jgi:hypothetical protein
LQILIKIKKPEIWDDPLGTAAAFWQSLPLAVFVAVNSFLSCLLAD